MTNLFPDIVPGVTTGAIAGSAINALGRSDESAIKIVSGSDVLSTESGYYKEGTLVLAKDSGKFWLFSGGSFVDSGSVISTISGIAGSSVMSDTTGSIVKHNASGVVSGSYNQVEVNDFGHVTSGSVLDLSSGWYSPNKTWTYASASTITVDAGAAAVYSVGDKIRWKQGGAYKYAYIITIADTLLTVTGGSDYTVANAAITDNYYSHATSPVGFPSSFDYAPTTEGLTVGSGTMQAKFALSGKICTTNIKFTLGAGSGVTGQLSFTFPITAALSIVSSGYIEDTGTQGYLAAVNCNTTVMYLVAINAAGTYAAQATPSSSVPHTWAATDVIKVNATYLIV